MEIVLYSTECPKCKVIKQKLNDKHISFYENNNTDEMALKGIKKVPVLEVDGKIMEFVEANAWVNSAENIK